jgi:hypothetical protein
VNWDNNETWHYERKGDEHRNPVAWLAIVPLMAIIAGWLYLAWQIVRVWG